MKSQAIKIIISATACILILLHQFTPIKIDLATGFLLLVAASPWLKSLLRFLEMPTNWKIALPGGWRFEYAQQLAKVAEEAEAVGIELETKLEGRTDAFLNISSKEPRLILAGLRIELEQTINRLLRAKGGELAENAPLPRKLAALKENGVVTPLEVDVIGDVIRMLTSAVEARRLEEKSCTQTLELGFGVLDTLQAKLNETGTETNPA